MPKRKADALSQLVGVDGNKKVKQGESSKLSKSKLLDESSSEDESGGGALLEEPGFKINQEFAKRFQHNKKREELARCESMLQS